MIQRWTRIAPFVLGVAFAALGILSLAVGSYVTGTLQLAFSAFWLLGPSKVVGRPHTGKSERGGA